MATWIIKRVDNEYQLIVDSWLCIHKENALQKMLDYVKMYPEQLETDGIIFDSGETIQEYLDNILKAENVEKILQYYGYTSLKKYGLCFGMYTDIDAKRLLLEQFSEDIAPHR